MEHKVISEQRGYLLIVASVVIVIVGLVGAILVSMYLTALRSTSNILQADQALYIAKSGLEIARRDLLKISSSLRCQDINTTNAKYSKACHALPGASGCSGRFSVWGEEVNQTTILANSIDNRSTTINLASSSELLSVGVITIDDEVIWYSGIADNQLLNVKRGAFNSLATSHSAGSSVMQNICLLTSEAGVPDLDNPEGKRVLQELLWKSTHGTGDGNSGSGLGTVLAATSMVNFGGNGTISNLSVSGFDDPSIVGSTIACGAQVTFNGSAETNIGPSPGQVASTKQVRKADISSYNGNITTNGDKLWHYYFSQSKNDLYTSLASQGKVVSNCNNYDYGSLTGTTWVNCNFNPHGSVTIGSSTAPVTIIVNSNNVNISSNNIIIYGLIYVIGSNLSVQGLRLWGQIAVEGTVNINGSVNFNYADFSSSSQYSDYYITREIFK